MRFARRERLPTVATGCAPSVPYLFHPNRPKNGRWPDCATAGVDAKRAEAVALTPSLSERWSSTVSLDGPRSRGRRLIAAMNLCTCGLRPRGSLSAWFSSTLAARRCVHSVRLDLQGDRVSGTHSSPAGAGLGFARDGGTVAAGSDDAILDPRSARSTRERTSA